MNKNAQQGLPIIAAGEGVLTCTNQLHIADELLTQQFFHLDEIVIELVLAVVKMTLFAGTMRNRVFHEA